LSNKEYEDEARRKNEIRKKIVKDEVRQKRVDLEARRE
jgi:LPS O-antigen subunit length determinant protein (WzzB/FepE family)